MEQDQQIHKDDAIRRAPRGPRTLIQWIALFAKITLILLLCLAGLAYYAYQSTQQLPDFYEATLNSDPVQLAESGAVFEQRVLDLRSSAQEAGEWQAVFTEQQINGWIAVDMPRKFPHWQPREVSDPRVSISRNELKLVFKVESPRLSGVVVAQADVFCTADNQIAVQFNSVKSGIVPIPMKRFADKITKGLEKSDIQVEWTEQDGDPVLLIKLPSDVTDQGDGNSVILKSVTLESGQVVLSGETSSN